MNYTCEICTDYIDPTKREEILERVSKIISKALQRHAAEQLQKGSENIEQDNHS